TRCARALVRWPKLPKRLDERRLRNGKILRSSPIMPRGFCMTRSGMTRAHPYAVYRPRMRTALLLGVLAIAGCSGDKTLEWKPQRSTACTVGDFTFAVPAGWRDISESKDPRLARLPEQLGPDAANTHVLVREQAKNTDTSVSVMLADLVGSPSCEQWVTAMNMQGGPKARMDSTTTETFGSDSGCSFQLLDGATEGRMVLRFRPPTFVVIQCLRRSEERRVGQEGSAW